MSIRQIPSLTTLRLKCSLLDGQVIDFSSWSDLFEHGDVFKRIDCTNNRLTSLPLELEELTNLEELILKRNNLSEIPEFIWKLTNMKIFDCSYNQLDSISDFIENFTELTTLSCGFNKLTSLPNLQNLAHLEYLYCPGNQLSEISPTIGELTQFKRILFNNNDLRKVPDEIVKLMTRYNLFELTLSHNPIEYYSHQMIDMIETIVKDTSGRLIHDCRDEPLTEDRLKHIISRRVDRHGLPAEFGFRCEIKKESLIYHEHDYPPSITL